MKSVCMTCGKVTKGNPEDKDISHTFCKACSEVYLAEQLAVADRLVKRQSMLINQANSKCVIHA